MSTLSGRWRVDSSPSTSTVTETTWHETETEAQAEADRRGRLCNGRAVAWWWPHDYQETDAEEIRRTTRQALTQHTTWLRKDSA